MDEQALRVFLSLAETENTRDTAALLRMGQSNVSRSLARLENHVGIELFARHGRRLALNAQGASFRADAVAVLDALDSARRHVDRLAQGEQMIRVGFLHSLARWMVPQSIQRFRLTEPDTRISLRQGFARELYGWLEADVIDVALSTPPTSNEPGVRWESRAREQLCVAVPPDHRLVGRTTATMSDVAGEDFIAFSRITELNAVVAHLLEDAGVEVSVTFESSEIDTMRALVAGGLGVSVLPLPHDGNDGGAVYVPLRPARHRDLGVAWSARRTTDRSIRAFLGSTI